MIIFSMTWLTTVCNFKQSSEPLFRSCVQRLTITRNCSVCDNQDVSSIALFETFTFASLFNLFITFSQSCSKFKQTCVFATILSSSWSRSCLCQIHFNTFSSQILKTLDQKAVATYNANEPIASAVKSPPQPLIYCEHNNGSAWGWKKI